MNDSIKLNEYERSCLEAYGILKYLVHSDRLVEEIEFHEDIIREQCPESLPLIRSNKFLSDFLNGNFYTEQIFLLVQEALEDIFDPEED